MPNLPATTRETFTSRLTTVMTMIGVAIGVSMRRHPDAIGG
jgi:SNF family Na+-dependent transporter